MNAQPTKYLGPIHLPREAYDRLERAAAEQERDPLQHARWLLRRALDGVADGTREPAFAAK